MFQQAGPAAVDVLAHGGARFRAQPLELAMFQLHQGSIRYLRDEPDFDLGAHRGVRLPLAVEVPADHETLRRFPHQHLADIGLRAVLAQLVPAPAQAWFQDRRLHRRLADRVGARPPAPEARREYLERVRLIGVDANAFAHRRDGDCAVHLPLSLALPWLVSTSAANAARASSQNWSSHLRSAPSPSGSM